MTLHYRAHEYEKHGSCAVDINAMSSEHDFFRQTLALHKYFDFTTVLENAGIEPSTTTKYHVSQHFTFFASITYKIVAKVNTLNAFYYQECHVSIM